MRVLIHASCRLNYQVKQTKPSIILLILSPPSPSVQRLIRIVLRCTKEVVCRNLRSTQSFSDSGPPPPPVRKFRNGLWNVIIEVFARARPGSVDRRRRADRRRPLSKDKTLTNLRRVNFVPLLRVISSPLPFAHKMSS